MDLSHLTPEQLKIYYKNPSRYGVYGSAIDGDRHMDAVPSTSRRRCFCGCKKRATHTGKANGVALITGCEFSIMYWVRNGYPLQPTKEKDNA